MPTPPVLPRELRFGVATANIQNLTDLSRPDTRIAIRATVNQAALVGFQETIELEDNEDILLEMPDTLWLHYGTVTEDDIAVRKSRFLPCPADRLPTGLPVDKNGVVQQNGFIILGKGKPDVQPTRMLTWAVLIFAENAELDPVIFCNLHLISGVDANKEPIQYRHEQRLIQAAAMENWFDMVVKIGLSVVWVGDTNWRLMPKMHPDEVSFVNSTIDKIRYIPGKQANWTLTLVDQERYNTPSDHDVFVGNLLLQVNDLYAPPVPAWKEMTGEERLVEWFARNGITNTREQLRLRSIFKAGGIAA